MSLNTENRKSTQLPLIVPILIVLLIAASFFIGVLWTKVSYLEKASTAKQATAPQQAGEAPPAPKIDINKIKDLFGKDVLKFGDKNKKLIFVEVADPSCPYCHIAGGKNPELAKQVGTRFQYKTDGGSYAPPVTEIRKLTEQGKASFVYLYSNGHGNGEMGTKAIFCGADQNKFWQVRDLLYSNAGYDLLNNTVKNDKAQSGALSDFLSKIADAKQLKSCLESGKYDAKIAENQTLSTSLGAQGTPAFFVNETMFSGAYSFTDMQQAVDTALKN